MPGGRWAREDLTAWSGPRMVIPVFTRTGNLARWVASQLLAKDSVFSGVQRAFLGSLDARRAVDRNIGRVLAGLNLPSHQEVERLYDDVRELEREVSALTRRAERLARR